jgi:SAM-dependent methyltransferase
MLFQSNGICPVCTTPGEKWCITQDWEYRSTTGFYTYLKCPSCFTLFLNELPAANLMDIYPRDYYSFSPTSESVVFKLKDWWDAIFYRSLLKKVQGSSLSVLDAGGGTGAVLDTLRKTDKRITYTEIIDIDKNAAVFAEKKGHVYTCSTIEDYHTSRKFDVVLLLNIIEHIADPASMIKKAGDLLSTGGIIIIKTPNSDSLDARLFRTTYWGGLHCPRHWIIFSDRSFSLMMQQSSLTVQKIRFTQGAPFWAWSVINLFRKKDIHRHKIPLINHPLFAVLSILFALFDIIRSPIAKTSQMFITLSK